MNKCTRRFGEMCILGATMVVFIFAFCNFDHFSQSSEHGKNQNENKTYLAFHLLYPIPFAANIVFFSFIFWQNKNQSSLTHKQYKNIYHFLLALQLSNLIFHINFVISLFFRFIYLCRCQWCTNVYAYTCKGAVKMRLLFFSLFSLKKYLNKWDSDLIFIPK